MLVAVVVRPAAQLVIVSKWLGWWVGRVFLHCNPPVNIKLMVKIMKQAIQTKEAPAAIGCYSQAIRSGNAVYLSGQIPLDPATMTVVEGDITAHVTRVFENLSRVAKAAGGSLDAIVKLTVFLTDIADLAIVNTVMPSYFKEPYPARTSIAVAALPKGVNVEIEGIMVLPS